jgi:hypothetical protein
VIASALRAVLAIPVDPKGTGSTGIASVVASGDVATKIEAWPTRLRAEFSLDGPSDRHLGSTASNPEGEIR